MALTMYTPAQQLTYGQPQYRGALRDWSRMIYQPYRQMMKQVQPALGQMMGHYQPGGGYGAGQRLEAEEAVRGGTARELGGMVASGMAGQFGARGTQVRAGAELSKLYKNIEDTRAQLQQQSFQPYAQIMSQMANLFQAKPKYGQYFQTGANIPASAQKIW